MEYRAKALFKLIFSRTFQDWPSFTSAYEACLALAISLELRIKLVYTVNVLKILTLFSFCSQIKFWLSRLDFTKCLSE